MACPVTAKPDLREDYFYNFVWLSYGRDNFIDVLLIKYINIVVHVSLHFVSLASYWLNIPVCPNWGYFIAVIIELDKL